MKGDYVPPGAYIEMKTIGESNMKSYFNRKNVYCIINAEMASRYIGDLGYFGSSFSDLEDAIKKGNINILKSIATGDDTEAGSIFLNDHGTYALFISAEKVNTEHTKTRYRPYTAQEILSETLFTTETYPAVQIRDKNNPEDVRVGKITEVLLKDNMIGIGTQLYSLQGLFANWELYELCTKTYQPFGKIIDDKNHS
jgi:hypothetical protein